MQMLKLLFGISFFLISSILPFTGIISQGQSSFESSETLDVSSDIPADPYSMRLDFMTESQVDDIILQKMITLDDLCDKTMGCRSRTDIVLAIGDKIRLFNDDRISSVELIRKEAGKKYTIANSTTTKKESYIIVPNEITRENIENYMLLIL